LQLISGGGSKGEEGEEDDEVEEDEEEEDEGKKEEVSKLLKSPKGKQEGMVGEFEPEEEPMEKEAQPEKTEPVGASKMKRVEIQAVEFDWIFRGQRASNFVEYLG